MSDTKVEDLEVIEVPPELRGLSDEEIIQRSERVLREVSGKRKKGERRPSKRVRQAIKEQKAHQEAMAIFGNSTQDGSYNAIPANKVELVKEAFTSRSAGFSTFDSKTINDIYAADSLKKYTVDYNSKSFLSAANVFASLKRNSTEPSESTKNAAPVRSMLSKAPEPTSGRVLKASFGAKTGEKPKAVIVSAADLALQKAEERAKKIREALQAKRAGAAAATTGAPGTTANVSGATSAPEVQPVKRPRGRPRKNPIA